MTIGKHVKDSYPSYEYQRINSNDGHPYFKVKDNKLIQTYNKSERSSLREIARFLSRHKNDDLPTEFYEKWPEIKKNIVKNWDKNFINRLFASLVNGGVIIERIDTYNAEFCFNQSLKKWEQDPEITGNKTEAVARLKEAFFGVWPSPLDVFALDLNGLQLSSLPDCFEFLYRLTSISLEGNRLTDLPKSFTQLERLSQLNLNNNSFKNLPEGSYLSSLHKLTISNNPLEAFPSNLPEKLRVLIFNHTGLPPWKIQSKWSYREQDHNFPQDSAIRAFNLQKNVGEWHDYLIAENPDNKENIRIAAEKILLNFMNKSKTLDLTDCGLSSLPDCIDELPHLEHLVLKGNPLTSFPKNLKHINGLITFK